MRYYPVHLDIKGRRCLVVGGGPVGTRKVHTLLDCGARVTVVSPEATEALEALADEGAITLKPRSYRPGDLSGMFLVIVATDDETLNRRISREAENMNLLCNVADRPDICNFILPSIVQQGDLIITISTSGKSPALAKKLRRQLENQFGGEYAELLQIMGAVRRKLLKQSHEPEAHREIFEKLINSDLLEMIRKKKYAGVDSLLESILGKGYRMEELLKTGQ